MTLLDIQPADTYTYTSLTRLRIRDLLLERTHDTQLAHEFEVVSSVLPFKVNWYVVDELID